MRFPSPAVPRRHRVATSFGASAVVAALFAVALLGRAAESGTDATVRPGDDFFVFANGEWLRQTTLPAGRHRWSARDEIAAQTRRQLEVVFQSAEESPAGSLGRKVADYRAALLDTASIEARGLAPLQTLLRSVDELRDKTALARWLGAELRADVDPLNAGIYASRHLLGLAVQGGIDGEERCLAFLLPGGLGLGAPENYRDESPAAKELRARYDAYIARLLTALGGEDQAGRAAAVLGLEIALSRRHRSAEEVARESNARHRWTRADFPMRAPGLAWEEFFAAAGLSGQEEFVAWQPDALTGVAELVGATPLAVWQDYLRFHLLDRYAEVLPAAVAAAAREFRGETAPDAAERARLALAETNQALAPLVGQLYVERFFPPVARAQVKEVAERMVAACARHIRTAAWLSAPSKTVALARLETLQFCVGYPDSWPVTAGLEFRVDDAFGNRRRLADWAYRAALDRLARPLDRREWTISPQTSGAVLNFTLNSYNFAAALLQPPKFDSAASRAAHYGSIGAIFAHEIFHFIDTLGADYAERGAARRWWTQADEVAFAAATRPLREQFAACEVLPGLKIDGERTAVENIADLAGLELAFEAHREALGARAQEAAVVRAEDRAFFIAFARAWRAQTDDEGLRRQIATDSHAPERWRVATVRNLAAWYAAFDVRSGDRWYLAPEARVRIW